MLTYCLRCKKDTENVDSKMLKTKNNKPFLLSKCAVWGNTKSRFMKEQEAKGLLKLVSTIFYQIFIFSPNDSPSKTMKNVFYFI